MDDQELEKRKEEERAKIREIARAAVEKSKQNQKEIEEKADKYLKEIEEGMDLLRELGKVLGVEQKPHLHVVPPVKKKEESNECEK